jgi:hypothetical protein
MTDQPAAHDRTDDPHTSPAHGATVAHIVEHLREDILGRARVSSKAN